LSAQR